MYSNHAGVLVSLVGAGPGDPELLTIKALRRIETADVVMYDRLVSAEILALGRPEAEYIHCGKEEGHQEEVQQEIFRLLVDRARRGLRVVRLKGGDPMLFGRGGEELEALERAGIEAEVVGGVSSALGAPHAAGIPLTYRGVARSVAIVTGRCKGGDLTDWSKVARVDTLVILMGIKYRARIAQSLIACGRDREEVVAFVERGTTAEERVVTGTMAEVAGGHVDVEAPAVWVCGEVVKYRWALKQALVEARA